MQTIPATVRTLAGFMILTSMFINANAATATAGEMDDKPVVVEPDASPIVRKASETFDARFRLMGFFGKIETEEDVHAIVREVAADVDWSQLTGADFAHLGTTEMFRRLPEDIATAARGRARELADLPGRDGAIGSFVSAMLSAGGRDAEHTRWMIKLLQHDGLAEMLSTPLAGTLFWRLQRIPQESAEEFKPHLLRLAEMIGPDTHAESASSVSRFYEGVYDIATADELDAIRSHMLAYLHSARAQLDEKHHTHIDSAFEFLSGAFGQKRLIGNPLPPLTILWSSDESITSLDDLRGRVVILDFGATWCGPCIASFPQKTQLHERYKGRAVTSVWVTSVQGFHITGDGARISTSGNPQREFELMKEFIAHHELPGLVVFTKEPVINIDLGVSGIPHVAIVDGEGRVRFNRLHPRGHHEQIVEHVDSLLVEAGLPTPDTEFAEP